MKCEQVCQEIREKKLSNVLQSTHEPTQGWVVKNKETQGGLFKYDDGSWVLMLNDPTTTWLVPLQMFDHVEGCMCQCCIENNNGSVHLPNR